MLNIPVNMGQARPPFVRFEEREYGRNNEASEAAGRPIPNIVTMACITSFGSKDTFEKPATEWLADIRRKAVNGEYPPEWVERFKLQFEEYQKGNELPREGTPIQTWQMVTMEQRSRLRAVSITTVEDLAAIPDSGLTMIGLDGRYLRDTAKAWVSEAKDKGVVSKQLADANAKIEALEQRIETLTRRAEEAEAKSGKSKAA